MARGQARRSWDRGGWDKRGRGEGIKGGRRGDVREIEEMGSKGQAMRAASAGPGSKSRREREGSRKRERRGNASHQANARRARRDPARSEAGRGPWARARARPAEETGDLIDVMAYCGLHARQLRERGEGEQGERERDRGGGTDGEAGRIVRGRVDVREGRGIDGRVLCTLDRDALHHDAVVACRATDPPAPSSAS